MTPRELRLRQKIDNLIDEKTVLETRMVRLERRVRQLHPCHCIYCGCPTRSSRACPSHRDLLAMEWAA